MLLPRNPEFSTEGDPYEPLYVPKQDVLENSLRREIEKFCFADSLMNRIVYDCMDPSGYTKVINFKLILKYSLFIYGLGSRP